MKKLDVLPSSYVDRLSEIIDLSWRYVKTQFGDKRHEFSIEASFQHYFAHIITKTGDLFCSRRNDVFHVDLETRSNATGKRSRIDITCSFEGKKAKCAIELKFKTAKQSAQDLGRIGSFDDIQKLEKYVNGKYDFGRFYIITDSTAYVKKSKRGNGTIFTMHDGAITKANSTFPYTISEQNKYVDKEVWLKHAYEFHWETLNDWYFLEIKVN